MTLSQLAHGLLPCIGMAKTGFLFTILFVSMTSFASKVRGNADGVQGKNKSSHPVGHEYHQGFSKRPHLLPVSKTLGRTSRLVERKKRSGHVVTKIKATLKALSVEDKILFQKGLIFRVAKQIEIGKHNKKPKSSLDKKIDDSYQDALFSDGSYGLVIDAMLKALFINKKQRKIIVEYRRSARPPEDMPLDLEFETKAAHVMGALQLLENDKNRIPLRIQIRRSNKNRFRFEIQSRDHLGHKTGFVALPYGEELKVLNRIFERRGHSIEEATSLFDKAKRETSATYEWPNKVRH